ncbi:hypothetical protein llap_14216 [Limosa lapponica baueri]|uniref:Uncharacterized protein n=1 Tax=Limosa lapponica baueri TaxID=1758121 RepID=A0A2I0TNX9_LIMLA|nr:hypothetical protein llap_14216 [Limosa lapponica baueri]
MQGTTSHPLSAVSLEFVQFECSQPSTGIPFAQQDSKVCPLAIVVFLDSKEIQRVVLAQKKNVMALAICHMQKAVMEKEPEPKLPIFQASDISSKSSSEEDQLNLQDHSRAVVPALKKAWHLGQLWELFQIPEAELVTGQWSTCHDALRQSKRERSEAHHLMSTNIRAPLRMEFSPPEKPEISKLSRIIEILVSSESDPYSFS